MWGTIAKKIIQAAKACGGDPANAKLIEALKVAKAAEVPKDLIDRNIKKATDKSQADYQEVLPLGPEQHSVEICPVR
jgi:transcriptional/translational regulatory protein YebC/TACO1